MLKELFSRSQAQEFVGPMSLFSQELSVRKIELQFVSRVVSTAARNVSADQMDARSREEEALMRAVEAGAFDSQIAEAVAGVEAAGLRRFDDVPGFSYPAWAERKHKG